jgi:hypothetical protein
MTTNKSDSEVFDFFANMKNMEIGGAIKSMEKNDDGSYYCRKIKDEAYIVSKVRDLRSCIYRRWTRVACLC